MKVVVRVLRRLLSSVLLLGLASRLPAVPSAVELYHQARKAERQGKVVEAYLLYSQASALDPRTPEYWVRAQALRTRATLEAKPLPPARPEEAAPQAAAPTDAPPLPPELLAAITDQQLEEARQYADIAQLEEPAERKAFESRGNSRELFERAAALYGYTAVFDNDYQPTPATRVALGESGLKELLRTLEAITQSFVVPLGPRLFLVARDTPQKRQELEPVVAVTVPIPAPVTVQEAQELARAVQTAMDLQRLQVDSGRRLVLVRDRASKVRPAQLLLAELMELKPQVSIEMEFLEVRADSSLRYGLGLPTSFPLINFGSLLGAFPPLLAAAPAIPAGFTRFLTFGGGKTFLGVGITDAHLFASMTQSNSTLRLRTELRSLDGQPATFTVGDRFPIVTAQFTGSNGGQVGDALAYPPQFQFEDLGLTLKVTPKIHGLDEVTLQVEAEFKVLGTQTFNGIPSISTRKYQSHVRLREGEWGVVAGLLSTTQVRTLSGLAGLSSIPVLGPLVRDNSRERFFGETLLVLKPKVLALPPSERVTRSLYVGTEAKPASVL